MSNPTTPGVNNDPTLATDPLTKKVNQRPLTGWQQGPEGPISSPSSTREWSQDDPAVTPPAPKAGFAQGTTEMPTAGSKEPSGPEGPAR